MSKHSKTSLSRKNSEYLACILKNEDVKIPKNNREELLSGLLLYYKLQHHELKNLRSHIIIESLKS